ncbi:MAG: mechanosensitive ion channel [Bacteroides sp.]|nr:mechanosensitive ion channel family protein [Bacteroides sp.]MDD2646168.1 mechanosensitive ion channel [Bacteroides sp.]MDD4055766.1 mechanosensitive ion channel [Bacteroides sp.]MDD4720643.1 mechanosensitive ion channel [Bacteroides sp.]NLI63596.1 mechanosensitive ion channel [Bacteroidales bacterium]
MMEQFLPQIIASIIILILLPVSRLIATKVIMKSGVLLQIPETRSLRVKQVVNIILNMVCVICLAIAWGVKRENILIGLSSVFAVIGVAFFAQWSLLSNITAGVIMFFTTPFRVGDRIHIYDKDLPINARIESIQTFYTHIRTDEGEIILVPNNLFLQRIVSVQKVD